MISDYLTQGKHWLKQHFHCWTISRCLNVNHSINCFSLTPEQYSRGQNFYPAALKRSQCQFGVCLMNAAMAQTLHNTNLEKQMRSLYGNSYGPGKKRWTSGHLHYHSTHQNYSNFVFSATTCCLEVSLHPSHNREWRKFHKTSSTATIFVWFELKCKSNCEIDYAIIQVWAWKQF